MSFYALYHNIIGRRTKTTSFIVLVSFLLTFILARGYVYLIDLGYLPDIYLNFGETHVHHFNYGIILLAISGFLGLVLNDEEEWLGKLAILYGIGLGLTFDEFALFLFLQDDYYARVSYEAIVVISAILINIIYLGDVWKRLWKYLLHKELF